MNTEPTELEVQTFNRDIAFVVINCAIGPLVGTASILIWTVFSAATQHGFSIQLPWHLIPGAVLRATAFFGIWGWLVGGMPAFFHSITLNILATKLNSRRWWVLLSPVSGCAWGAIMIIALSGSLPKTRDALVVSLLPGCVAAIACVWLASALRQLPPLRDERASNSRGR